MADIAALGQPQYFDNVHPKILPVGYRIPLNIDLCGPAQALLLVRPHRLARQAKIQGTPGLHFDEAKNAVSKGNDIDLAQPAAKISLQKRITAFFQISGGLLLAPSAKFCSIHAHTSI
jgi:hypothetical protein